MIDRYRKAIPLIFLVAALTGCTAANETVIDDVTGKTGAQQQASATDGAVTTAVGADGQPIQEVTIPQEEPVTEDMTGTAASKENASLTEAQAASVQLKQNTDTQALYAIHFDFDKYTVSDAQRELLAKNAAWLKSSPKTSVLIEGHADERGETEYNLALGDRRANSIKKFLEDLGVAQDRLSTIS